MTPPDQRPVDSAMYADRPEKTAVRGLWLDVVVNYSSAYPDDEYPLYLTLSGAEGKDIQLLIDSGVVETTETGSIPAALKHRVIAVESNSAAVLMLNRRFPGLKIFEHPFHALVRSASATRWPNGDDEKFCRARVVNLDLNQTLSAEHHEGELRFPILQWIQKLSQIHAVPRIDWSLCLTLHGEVLWPPSTCESVQRYLNENFEREPSFATSCARFLGDDLFAAVRGAEACNFSQRSGVDQQKVLMAFVPKKIAQLVHGHGWSVQTSRNLHYGGSGGHAPMVTWIIDFVWEPRVFETPEAIYREALAQVLTGAGCIAENGNIS
jgi:hypothetical protein